MARLVTSGFLLGAGMKDTFFHPSRYREGVTGRASCKAVPSPTRPVGRQTCCVPGRHTVTWGLCEPTGGFVATV